MHKATDETPESPAAGEYAPFFNAYVSLITSGPEPDVLAVLAQQPGEIRQLATMVATEQETSRYAPGKWSVREVMGHVIDAERVFGYRTFCISRGDQTPLPGFDENDYVAASGFAEQSLKTLAEEFELVREANLATLRRLESSAWTRMGNANGSAVSVRALAYITAGHVRHHLNVLRDRYRIGVE